MLAVTSSSQRSALWGHAGLGAAAIAFGLEEWLSVLLHWNDIRPFTFMGWHREHLLTGALFFGVGALVLTLALRSRGTTRRLLSLALLSLLACCEYARHFTMPGACLALLGATDGAVLAASARRWAASAIFGATLALLLAVGAMVFAATPDSTGVRLDPAAPKVAHDPRFDAFARETYLSSGVVPKDFLGFFDEQGDTAGYERELRRTVIDAVALSNAYAERTGLPVRITEKEVAITFLAEGGALVLSSMPDALERMHPVNGIGLDNYRSGFREYAPLTAALDEALGTRLQHLDLHLGPITVLCRPMTFREAIAGTALMYLHQKVRTARASPQPLGAMPLDRQFVLASLVYNSGVLFAPERVDQILGFRTADYLAEVNTLNRGKRPLLPIASREEMLRRLAAGEPLPRQLTSWSAVYHVLQRYGAWAGVERFSSTFDAQGAFIRRP